MKPTIILSLFIAFFLSFCSQDKKTEPIKDLELKSIPAISIADSMVIDFINQFINIPENIHRKVFTIFIDQRHDTLAVTIWRYLRKKIVLDNVLGYFNYQDRTILIYSPFTDFLNIPNDSKTVNELNIKYKDELEYYKFHRHELVMWQLQYTYYDKKYSLNKSFNRIEHTLKLPYHDSVKVDIQWPAD